MCEVKLNQDPEPLLCGAVADGTLVAAKKRVNYMPAFTCKDNSKNFQSPHYFLETYKSQVPNLPTRGHTSSSTPQPCL